MLSVSVLTSGGSETPLYPTTSRLVSESRWMAGLDLSQQMAFMVEWPSRQRELWSSGRNQPCCMEGNVLPLPELEIPELVPVSMQLFVSFLKESTSHECWPQSW